MSKRVRISVVVPAYNEEAELPSLLEGLRKQDISKSFEVIVVNNNSTDSTSKVAKKYGAKVVKEKNQGITYARLRGVLVSKGEIVVQTDADCKVMSKF